MSSSVAVRFARPAATHDMPFELCSVAMNCVKRCLNWRITTLRFLRERSRIVCGVLAVKKKKKKNVEFVLRSCFDILPERKN